MPADSPLITGLAWGRTEVGGLGTCKDAKLWPGGGRAWDWDETGTRHRPGIQLADVAELLDNGADVVVLSQGMEMALHVPPEVLTVLAGRGIEAHARPTPEAVDLYNELAASRAVGALIHSTC